jgi:hypothetical protein
MEISNIVLWCSLTNLVSIPWYEKATVLLIASFAISEPVKLKCVFRIIANFPFFWCQEHDAVQVGYHCR